MVKDSAEKIFSLFESTEFDAGSWNYPSRRLPDSARLMAQPDAMYTNCRRVPQGNEFRNAMTLLSFLSHPYNYALDPYQRLQMKGFSLISLDNPAWSMPFVHFDKKVSELEADSLESVLNEVLDAGEPHLAVEDLLHAEEQKSRAENRLELILAAARIRNECYGPAQVQEILGVSRERLRQLREKGRLVGITGGERKGTLYPYWQFDPEGRTFDGVGEIYSAAKKAGMTERQLHFFMTERNPRLDGRQPAEILLRASRRDKADVREAANRIVEVILSSGPGTL